MQPSGRYSFLACGIAVVLLAASVPAKATDFNWVVLNGSFTTSSNWTPFSIFPPISGPGGAADTTNFDLGMPPIARYQVSNVNGQNRRMLVHNDSVRLTFSGAYTLLETDAAAPSFTVGVASGDQGNVVLEGAGPFATKHTALGLVAGSQGIVTVSSGTVWNNTNHLRVGGPGQGTLTIQGGSVHVGQTLFIGEDSTVNLQGGTLRFDGYQRQGTFNYQSGTVRLGGFRTIGTDATILELFGAESQVPAGKGLVIEEHATFHTDATIDGGVFTAGSTWIGEQQPGSLTITGGATATSAITHISGGVIPVATQDGAVTVSGPGSTWTTSALAVGRYGRGTLDVLDGAAVSSTGGSIGAVSGAVRISGEGSSWVMSGELRVGDEGDAEFTIEDGGSVSTTTSLLAHQAGSTATAIVRGAGSTWTIRPNEASVNHLYVGRAGHAELTITQGALVRVSNGSGTAVLAALGNASGTLNLGAPAGQPATTPGILDAAEVRGDVGAGGAALVFNHTGNCFFTRTGLADGSPIPVTGTTAVSLYGPGTVWFLGANSYTGGTTIHDGRLTLYNNGSITGNVVNNGQLAFQRANNLTFSGNISGTGALFQLSANTLALSGTNTYTGGTAVVNGTIRRVLTGSLPNNAPYETVNGMLILDGVGPLTVSSLIGSGGSIDLRSNALFIDQSADTTYAGALFGNGTVTKRGNGRLALSGVSTYVGSTTVEAGTLEVNGQITTSTVIVADGGTLGGAGSVATLINTAGDVTPGHGVGALTVTGSYTQAADGALTLELGGTAPGQFDQLVVTGAATLAGTLNVDSVDGFTPQPGDYFDIVVAGSVNGTFDAPPAPWVVKYGPTYARLFIPLAADFDADGDVDSDDVAEFVACRTRDKVPHDGSPACEQADFDGDGDVDLDDFGVVQRCYAGPDLLPAPGCAN